MKRLLKSDFYYHIKNIKIYIYVLIFLSIYIIGASTGNIEWSSSIEFGQLFEIMLKQQYLMILIALLGSTCFYQGKVFDNKFIMYQIISQGRLKTILSKYIVQIIFNVLLSALVIAFALTGLSFIYDVRLSIGTEILKMFILFSLLIMRYSIFLVSIVLLVKKGIVGALTAWMIIICEALPLIVGTEYGINNLLFISNFFVPGQLNMLSQIDSIEPAIILLTTVIELSMEIFITLRKYKKEDLI